MVDIEADATGVGSARLLSAGSHLAYNRSERRHLLHGGHRRQLTLYGIDCVRAVLHMSRVQQVNILQIGGCTVANAPHIEKRVLST